jgi:hypothetical protein
LLGGSRSPRQTTPWHVPSTFLGLAFPATRIALATHQSAATE